MKYNHLLWYPDVRCSYCVCIQCPPEPAEYITGPKKQWIIIITFYWLLYKSVNDIQWFLNITSLSETDPFKNKWSSNPCVEHLRERKNKCIYLMHLITFLKS